VSKARRVASLAEVPAGQLTLVELDGTRIVLARVGDRVYACGDTSPTGAAR
jgi:nitrite reductase/ring-hydroxylating ferredoxin subunit